MTAQIRRSEAAGERIGGMLRAVLFDLDDTLVDHEAAAASAQKLGLADEVDLFIASSTLPAGKPNPRAFQHATAEIDVDPVDAMMVGNSLDGDVLGALGAGLSAVLLDRYDAYPDVDVPRVATLDELDFGPDTARAVT